jgi:hypothetical protein
MSRFGPKAAGENCRIATVAACMKRVCFHAHESSLARSFTKQELAPAALPCRTSA